MMNPVAQEDGPQKAPTASRFLKVHPEKVLGFKRVRCANKKSPPVKVGLVKVCYFAFYLKQE